MPQPEKRDIWFNSSDKKNKVAAYIYTDKTVEPTCVLQISHGMCEYIGRYDDFAFTLASKGIAVCGNDHLGHGKTAKPEDYGFFAEKGGRQYVLKDLKTMNDIAHKEFPGLPVFLLGHSMGSFFAREYATVWPESIQGLIISGTGGRNPLAGAGIMLTSLLSAIKGAHYRSNLVHSMAFGQYLKRIDSPRTEYDWISRDTEIVDRYAADPLCTFRFTVNGFHELMSQLQTVNRPQWAGKIPKSLPVLMIQGDGDPVGNYGQGTAQVRDSLLNAGVKNLTYIEYPGARHEVLNETNRQQVYQDVIDFIEKWRK